MLLDSHKSVVISTGQNQSDSFGDDNTELRWVRDDKVVFLVFFYITDDTEIIVANTASLPITMRGCTMQETIIHGTQRQYFTPVNTTAHTPVRAQSCNQHRRKALCPRATAFTVPPLPSHCCPESQTEQRQKKETTSAVFFFKNKQTVTTLWPYPRCNGSPVLCVC